MWRVRSARSLFLSATGAIYMMAFVSYYVQYPGLFGADGLEPASPYLQRIAKHFGVPAKPGNWPELSRAFQAFPSLLWLAESLGWDCDAFLEGCALLGAGLGTLSTAGVHHAAMYLAMWFLYSTLFAHGGSMLTFQWDILLLECGALTVLYGALVRNSSSDSPAVRWLFRGLSFKLFLMTASVKVQANCPTWKELTALEYHHASTCIPTSAAWWVHQMPPEFHRLSVAFVFVCQLPGALLLIAPISQCRRVGAFLQVLCMVFIQVTGNYNWFNMHTALLMLPVWEDDSSSDGSSDAQPGEDTPLWRSGVDMLIAAGLCYVFQVTTMPREQEALIVLFVVVYCFRRHWGCGKRGLMAKFVGCLGYLTGILFLAAASLQMYKVKFVGANPKVVEALRGSLWEMWAPLEGLRISNLVTPQSLSTGLGFGLPVVCRYLMVVIGLASFQHAFSQIESARKCDGRLWPLTTPLRLAYTTCLGLVCITIFGLQWAPFESIHRGSHDMLPKGCLPFDVSRRWSQKAQQLHIVSSYGLFRRMTGVGEFSGPGYEYGDKWGWGGKRPQAVRVPVLVLEGSLHGPDGPWKEIEMRYKPGHLDRPPPYVAPHQPRMDWRMWFAALGNYQSDPWVIHLIAKLLLGKEDVLNLVGRSLGGTHQYDFTSDPPKAIRATLHHYDFTRLPSAWNERIPKPKVIINWTSPQWWARVSDPRPWLPPITETSSQLDQFLEGQGWAPMRKQRKLGMQSIASRACRPAKTDILPFWLRHHAWVLEKACSAVLSTRAAAQGLRRGDYTLRAMAGLTLISVALRVMATATVFFAAWLRGRVARANEKTKLD